MPKSVRLKKSNKKSTRKSKLQIRITLIQILEYTTKDWITNVVNVTPTVNTSMISNTIDNTHLNIAYNVALISREELLGA